MEKAYRVYDEDHILVGKFVSKSLADKLKQQHPTHVIVVFDVDSGNPQGPERVDLLEYPELLEDADRSALAEKLLQVFPWLDIAHDSNDQPISGADTIDDLQQLYHSLKATQHA